MTKIKDLYKVYLPKWPALIVVGKTVTKEQAAEIIVRTTDWYLSTNDKEWIREVYTAINIPLKKLDNSYREWDYKDVDVFEETIDSLDLQYLHNQQVATCYIGGPHGWCDWDGKIFCNTYNVGKWPSIEEIHKEWKLIAKAFPFLELKSQLLDEEFGRENLEYTGKQTPLIQFNVKNGKVTTKIPKEVIIPTVDNTNYFLNTINSSYRERGIDIDTLKWAVELVQNKYKNIPIRD